MRSLCGLSLRAPRLPLLAALALVWVAPASAGASKDAAASASEAEPAPYRPKELADIDIEDRLGNKVPLDVVLTDSRGERVELRRYFSGEQSGKPVLLTLGYYTCPMLCSLVLNATLEALREVSLDVGEDFTVVSVSIDPRDTVDIARGKQKTYLKSYGREGAQEGWHFHVADEAEVKRLADAVGFRYRWDESTKQYAHAAGIFFLSPDGTLTRTLYGISYDPTDVKLALMEASRGEVGTITDKILLSCFRYTADSQRYGVYVWGVMRLAGVLTIIFLGGLLGALWYRERKKSQASRGEG